MFDEDEGGGIREESLMTYFVWYRGNYERLYGVGVGGEGSGLKKT